MELGKSGQRHRFAECYEYMKFPLLTELVDTVVVREHEQNQYGPLRQADLVVRGSVLKLGWASSNPECILDSGKIEHEYVLDEDTPPLSSQLLFHAIHRNKFEISEIYGLLLEKIDGDQEGILSARRLRFMKMNGVPESQIKESFVICLVRVLVLDRCLGTSLKCPLNFDPKICHCQAFWGDYGLPGNRTVYVLQLETMLPIPAIRVFCCS